VDLEFLDYADLPPPLHRRLLAVRADALRLPFPDRAFDAVLSLDLLEHLPLRSRAPAVAEMLRVADRRVVLGCPVAEGWDGWERALLAAYRALGRAVPGWLREHRERGLPRRGELRALLGAPGWRGRAVAGVNGAVQFLLCLLEMTPAGSLADRVLGEAGPRGPAPVAAAAGRLLDLLSFGPEGRALLVLDREEAA